jgi:hypothetical protein
MLELPMHIMVNRLKANNSKKDHSSMHIYPTQINNLHRIMLQNKRHYTTTIPKI